ncbi:DUF3667 domain-containing protein [uncultured Flavobacterium sp.]|uniref:DUF3667 domain-containing protein n=1 Tax=uncultured Flavobacterium sp. TaxID=165435 RepID=UPI0030EDB668|tara:strand:+ start:16672 stop:17787 length:1116 start_codon:yes stop_codon:yes gene_type:complete
MGIKPTREDKTCQNCNHVVQDRFCPKCGQENIETRKSFRHIFSHFLKDLTHYDSKFWKTIFTLFFKPAALSKAYISGKRLRYLDPFRLYLFISFITFLTLSLFSVTTPDVKDTPKVIQTKENNIPSIDSLHIKEKSIDGLTKIGLITQKNNDTIKKILKESDATHSKEIHTKEVHSKENNDKGLFKLGYKNLAELDSLQKTGSENLEENTTKYWFLKKWLSVEEERTEKEIFTDFKMSFSKNFPKVMFLYLPLFAFILYLFHNKKHWFYFDHSIFTLHYFSFLLLMTLALFFVDKLKPLAETYPNIAWLHFGLKTLGYVYMLYYFFPAHRLFYGDKFFLSFFKSSLVYIINIILFSVMLILFSLYTFLNLN